MGASESALTANPDKQVEPSSIGQSIFFKLSLCREGSQLEGANYLLCKGRDDPTLRSPSFPWNQPPILFLYWRFQPALDIENDPLFRSMCLHCSKQ
jgi:hypothetical protein